MSKRFIDTELWVKPWFFELTPAEKLAFLYLLSQCDAVGVWTCNFRMAEFTIGSQLDWNKFRDKCHGNIEQITETKWWLVDFCIFQHQDLSPENGEVESKNNAVRGYVKALRKHGLWDKYVLRFNEVFHDMLAPSRPQAGALCKGKGKGKGKGKEASKKSRADATHEETGLPMNQKSYNELVEVYGSRTVDDYMQRAADYRDSKGVEYLDYAATIRNWMKKAEESGQLQRRVKVKRPERVYGGLPDASE